MAMPRTLTPYIYPKEQIDEHIYAAQVLSDIFNMGIDLEVPVEEMEFTPLHELEHMLNTFNRYIEVTKKQISRTARVNLIKAMMAEDDRKDEYDLDHYAEIFFSYPKYSGITVGFLKLFHEAGLFTANPALLNTLFVLTITHYSSGSHLINVADFLLGIGANPNYCGTEGSNNPNKLTAMHLSLLTENEELSLLMLKKSQILIDYTLQDSEGRTVLVLAAKMRKHIIYSQMMKDANARLALGIADNENRNALHYGYLLGQVTVINETMQNASIISGTVDIFGNTPYKLLSAPLGEIKRVLNSVAIDENRHPSMKKNFFYLTHTMPIGLPTSEQTLRGLLVGQFDANGVRLPVAAYMPGQKDTVLVPILSCSMNANYVKQFRQRITDLNPNLPIQIKFLWDLQQPCLDAMIIHSITLIQEISLKVQAMINDRNMISVSSLSIFATPAVQQAGHTQTEQKEQSKPRKRKK
jgi:hypothetical protein